MKPTLRAGLAVSLALFALAVSAADKSISLLNGKDLSGWKIVGKGSNHWQYGKAALEKLGAWDRVKDKVAQAESVRAALLLVSRGEAPLGIVYETDAKVDPSVKIIGVFPEDSHPPIIYPVAMTKDAKPDAAQYLAFLTTPEAKAVFERYGFRVLGKP